jgi:hypothetical protein
MMVHQDEYITLLHLRRVAYKQTWLKTHGGAERRAAARFSWDMLNLEAYVNAVGAHAAVALCSAGKKSKTPTRRFLLLCVLSHTRAKCVLAQLKVGAPYVFEQRSGASKPGVASFRLRGFACRTLAGTSCRLPSPPTTRASPATAKPRKRTATAAGPPHTPTCLAAAAAMEAGGAAEAAKPPPCRRMRGGGARGRRQRRRRSVGRGPRSGRPPSGACRPSSSTSSPSGKPIW